MLIYYSYGITPLTLYPVMLVLKSVGQNDNDCYCLGIRCNMGKLLAKSRPALLSSSSLADQSSLRNYRRLFHPLRERSPILKKPKRVYTLIFKLDHILQHMKTYLDLAASGCEAPVISFSPPPPSLLFFTLILAKGGNWDFSTHFMILLSQSQSWWRKLPIVPVKF